MKMLLSAELATCQVLSSSLENHRPWDTSVVSRKFSQGVLQDPGPKETTTTPRLPRGFLEAICMGGAERAQGKQSRVADRGSACYSPCSGQRWEAAEKGTNRAGRVSALELGVPRAWC